MIQRARRRKSGKIEAGGDSRSAFITLMNRAGHGKKRKNRGRSDRERREEERQQPSGRPSKLGLKWKFQLCAAEGV